MNGIGASPHSSGDAELFDLLTEWIQQHRRNGGDFSIDAIAAAREAGRTALRSGYSTAQAFEAARTAYFASPGTDHESGRSTPALEPASPALVVPK